MRARIDYITKEGDMEITVGFIEFDMQDEGMQMSLLPLYQTYEAEISEEELDEFYPENSFDALFEYFMEYFEDKTTHICVIDGEYKGFVTFHLDCEEVPGYAAEYRGWGHISEIYVDKQLRKHGLGKIMVSRAEEELKKLDIKGIYLSDIVGNPTFWKSLNYTDTGKLNLTKAVGFMKNKCS